MSFIDYPWRYAHVPQAETALRLYQNIAHGAPPALVVSGPMAQQDRGALVAARPIFDWHADTAYFPPVEMRDIRIEMASDVRRVQAAVLGRTLRVEGAGGRRLFTLPRLQAYEVLVVE